MNLKRKPIEDEKRARAYEIYERGGRVKGRDLDNWIEAEQIVVDQHVKNESPEDGDGTSSSVPFEGSGY